MASPTVVSRSTYGDAGANTSHTVTLPASIVSGNLLLLLISLSSTGTTITTPTGWTPVSGYAQSAHAPTTAAFFKTATGSEGASVTVATSNTKLSSTCYQISGWSGTPEASTAALSGSNSTTPDPPSLTPSWGALANLYIAVGHDATNSTLTSAPTNYTNGIAGTASVAGNTSACASAERQLTGSPEDPGTFTLSSSASWVAYTIAVKPAAGPTTFNQTVTVTCGGAVSVIKSVSKSILLASASATAIIKSVGKPVAATSTSSTALSRSVGKIVAVTSSGTVTFARFISKGVPVACTGTVAVVKRVTHAMAIGCASAAAVVKSVGKPIATSVSTATAFTRSVGKIIATAATTTTGIIPGILFLVSISVTVTTATSLLKRGMRSPLVALLRGGTYWKGRGH